MVRTVPKKLVLAAVLVATLIMTFYYARSGSKWSESAKATPSSSHDRRQQHYLPVAPQREVNHSTTSFKHVTKSNTAIRKRKNKPQFCPANGLERAKADIETVDILPTLNFDVRFLFDTLIHA